MQHLFQELQKPEIFAWFSSFYPRKRSLKIPYGSIPPKNWCETVGIQGREEGEETFRSRRKGCSEWRQQSSDFPPRLGALGCSRWPKWAPQVINWRCERWETCWRYPTWNYIITVWTWKWMVGILVSFWDGFSGAMLVLPSVPIFTPFLRMFWGSHKRVADTFRELKEKRRVHDASWSALPI